MEQPNLQRWRFFLKDYPSPDSFVDLGYYLLISACLQRRVWISNGFNKLYTNMFAVLCGESGVGKGMIIKEIHRVLTNKRMLKVANLGDNRLGLEHELGEAIPTNKKNERMDNMVIPIAPDATTFEDLCGIMGRGARPLWFPTGKINASGKPELRPEFHSSVLFNLDEMESIFHKDSQKINVMFNICYDCREEYEYSTKSQGKDYVKRPCINLIAGATPNFLRRIFSSQLLREGFASRTIFAVESKGRLRNYEPPEHSKEQLEAYEQLIDHIVKVSKVQGALTWSSEALAFNKRWFEIEYGLKLPNPHPKLQPYYARINITHAKLSAAIHYGEHSDKSEIGIDTAKKALSFLQQLELKMHKAVDAEQTNPLSKVTDEIQEYFKAVKNEKLITNKLLVTEFFHSFPADPWDDVVKVVKYLKDINFIAEHPGGKSNAYIYIEPSEDKK